MQSPELISRKAMAALRDQRTTREMSAVSLAELAIKQSCGKLNLDKADTGTGLSDLKIRVLSYTVDHAWQMFGLPLHHKDPFDRQIIAQALVEEIPIVTPDKAFRAYKGVEIIW